MERQQKSSEEHEIVGKQVLQSFEIGTIQVRQAGEHEYGIRYFDTLDPMEKKQLNSI